MSKGWEGLWEECLHLEQLQASLPGHLDGPWQGPGAAWTFLHVRPVSKVYPDQHNRH